MRNPAREEMDARARRVTFTARSIFRVSCVSLTPLWCGLVTGYSSIITMAGYPSDQKEASSPQ